MAALTHTIGGTTYTEVASTPGKYSLGCFPHAQNSQVWEYHPPGVDGVQTIYGGRQGQHLTAKCRYIGPAATLLAQWEADLASWANKSVSVTASSGTVFPRCRVLDDSGPIGDPVGMGGQSPMAYQDFRVNLKRLD
jgi:hypothetical protein